jgi:uncharacterized membrane protein YphA (DoxX/SURF4 family)
MDSLLELGRVLFAIAIAAFGVQYLHYGQFVGGLPPVPPWTPGGSFFAYVVGAALVVAGLCIAAKMKARLAATLVGMLFFGCVVFLHALRAVAILHDGNIRTGAFEALALSGAAFVLAGALPIEQPYLSGWDTLTNRLAKAGRFIFAISMLVFGVQHFMYAAYIASLVTAWIPAHLFWVYFTGVGFIAAGLCIAFNKLASLAAASLGLMFFLWVCVLHGPRVAARLHNGDEWNSAFVALAMCGASFIIAGVMSNEHRPAEVREFLRPQAQ